MKRSSIILIISFFTCFAARPLLAASPDSSHLQVSKTIFVKAFLDKSTPEGAGGLLVRQKTTGHQEKPPAVGLVAELGKHRLSFSYQGGDSRSFDTDGKTSSLQEEILTGIDYDVYDFIYQYELIKVRNSLAGFSLGVIGQFKLMEGQTELLADGQLRKEDFTASIPLIGLNLHMGFLGDLVEGRFRATGIDHGNFYDGQAEVALCPNPLLDIYGGYRFNFIDIGTADTKLGHDKSGPYLGVTFSF